MWTFPISSSTTTEDSPPPITIAKEVEPTACETECTQQQKALVSCVESIRAARMQQAQQVDQNDGGDGDGDDTTTSTDTPECLPLAVAAWTKCCEEANLRQKEQQKEEDEEKKSNDWCSVLPNGSHATPPSDTARAPHCSRSNTILSRYVTSYSISSYIKPRFILHCDFETMILRWIRIPLLDIPPMCSSALEFLMNNVSLNWSNLNISTCNV